MEKIKSLFSMMTGHGIAMAIAAVIIGLVLIASNFLISTLPILWLVVVIAHFFDMLLEISAWSIFFWWCGCILAALISIGLTILTSTWLERK